MPIIGKYLTKNLLAKPFRTFLLVVCITACAFVACLSLDITGNMEKLMKSMLMQMIGTADILVADPVGVEAPLELPYANEQLLVYSVKGGLIDRNSEFYAYYHKTDYEITAIDYDIAYKMRLLPIKLDPQSGETAVSEKLAREAGWSVGDTVTLYDSENHPLDYEIKTIVPGRGLTNNANLLFLSQEEFAKLATGVRAKSIYVDLADDGEAGTAAALIEELDFNAKTENFMEKDEFQQMLGELRILFLMIFAVCFLLVIFVAISVSNRIVSERFSVVGTFRSLGISASYCTGLLLAENVLYGLLGGLVGVGLYAALRDSILGSIIQVDVTAGYEVKLEMPPMSPLSVLAVLLLSVLIMCACPLREILRTSKTAIRDIIFNNKDTAYRMNKVAGLIGLLCAAGAAVTFFLKQSNLAQVLCFVLIIASVAMLFPWLLRGIASCFEKLFERLGMPIARLAATESFSRKSTVGSAGLCVTASTLAIIIFIFASTLGSMYELDNYDCDVIVWASDKQEVSRFSYIKQLEDVTDTELIFNKETEMKINGKKTTLTVFGLNESGFRLMTAIKGCPETIDKDSFVMDRSLAKRMGLQEGDCVEVTFDSNSYMPLTKTLTLTALVDAYDYDTTGNVAVLSKELYQDMYHAYPGQILVRSGNPEKTAAQIRKYSAVTVEDIKTAEEYQAYWEEKESGMRGMLTIVIVLGVGLTVIGMISNQLIGFQGRKRECAVLISTSMTRGKLSRMFLLESMIAAGIALIVALPIAMTAFVPFRKLLENMESAVTIVIDVKLYVLFLAALWCVFTLVALFPIRELRRMKLAEQLKYE